VDVEIDDSGARVTDHDAAGVHLADAGSEVLPGGEVQIDDAVDRAHRVGHVGGHDIMGEERPLFFRELNRRDRHIAGNPVILGLSHDAPCSGAERLFF
jgi:hypothetical protein